MRHVSPFYIPPTLPLRQLGSLLLLGALARWRHVFEWLVRHGVRCAPGAAGALGMGCIGFPNHPVWEVTARCNLNCIHCHARGSPRVGRELTTEEGLRLLDELAKIEGFRMVAFTGGEPLLRDDLFQFLSHARKLGLSSTIATNGTLVDRSVAKELKRSGVAIAAVSIDGCNATTHDRIRGAKGAFDKAMEGIDALNEAGIPLHINLTAMEQNLEDLEEIVELADRMNAAIFLVYQLVPVGRGSEIRDSALDAKRHERLVEAIAELQAASRAIMEPVAAPQYWAHLLARRWISYGAILRLAELLFHGCCAGRGFAYIKPDGEVWPCPFLEINCGNVRMRTFGEIWRDSPVLNELRMRETHLKGRCGECAYRRLCGGCRARAFVMRGDYLQEDPFCFIDEGRG